MDLNKGTAEAAHLRIGIRVEIVAHTGYQGGRIDAWRCNPVTYPTAKGRVIYIGASQHQARYHLGGQGQQQRCHRQSTQGVVAKITGSDATDIVLQRRHITFTQGQDHSPARIPAAPKAPDQAPQQVHGKDITRIDMDGFE